MKPFFSWYLTCFSSLPPSVDQAHSTGGECPAPMSDGAMQMAVFSSPMRSRRVMTVDPSAKQHVYAVRSRETERVPFIFRALIAPVALLVIMTTGVGQSASGQTAADQTAAGQTAPGQTAADQTASR